MGQDTFIDWQLGTQAAFDQMVPLGMRRDELLCHRPGVAPLSAWSRSVAAHGQRTRVDEGRSTSARFAGLSNTDKLGVALRSTAGALGPEMGGKLQELTSPTNLAIMAGALAIWVGAHATPIGWVVDIGMVGLGVVALGAEAVSVMRELHAFGMGVIKARSEADLMDAGRHLAKAVAIVGVDVVVAILLKKAIVKVRQPVAGGGGAEGGTKLFGKYDAQDAVKSLPPGGAATTGGQAAQNVVNKTAGTAPITNPGYPAKGRVDNCVNCVVATDATFAGRPASALPQFDPRGVPISEIPKAIGAQGGFNNVKSLGDVESVFGSFGPGARGVVFGDRGPGQVGHVFNVVVDQRGVVKFWDGQSMASPVIDGQGYKNFWWIRSGE